MTCRPRICPDIKDLGQDVLKDVVCPIESCNKKFPQQTALRIHLKNFHGHQITNKWSDYEKANATFHCPAEECIYGITKEKYFTSFVLLKQHYLKVHAEKKHYCDGCEAAFSLQRFLRAHQKHKCPARKAEREKNKKVEKEPTQVPSSVNIHLHPVVIMPMNSAQSDATNPLKSVLEMLQPSRLFGNSHTPADEARNQNIGAKYSLGSSFDRHLNADNKDVRHPDTGANNELFKQISHVISNISQTNIHNNQDNNVVQTTTGWNNVIECNNVASTIAECSNTASTITECNNEATIISQCNSEAAMIQNSKSEASANTQCNILLNECQNKDTHVNEYNKEVIEVGNYASEMRTEKVSYSDNLELNQTVIKSSVNKLGAESIKQMNDNTSDIINWNFCIGSEVCIDDDSSSDLKNDQDVNRISLNASDVNLSTNNCDNGLIQNETSEELSQSNKAKNILNEHCYANEKAGYVINDNKIDDLSQKPKITSKSLKPILPIPNMFILPQVFKSGVPLEQQVLMIANTAPLERISLAKPAVPIRQRRILPYPSTTCVGDVRTTAAVQTDGLNSKFATTETQKNRSSLTNELPMRFNCVEKQTRIKSCEISAQTGQKYDCSQMRELHNDMSVQADYNVANTQSHIMYSNTAAVNSFDTQTQTELNYNMNTQATEILNNTSSQIKSDSVNIQTHTGLTQTPSGILYSDTSVQTGVKSDGATAQTQTVNMLDSASTQTYVTFDGMNTQTQTEMLYNGTNAHTQTTTVKNQPVITVDTASAQTQSGVLDTFLTKSQSQLYEHGNTVQTQTSSSQDGDSILTKAMACAQIPIEKQSRASQVSPRAKTKHHQNCQTQTLRQRKRQAQKQLATSDFAVNTDLVYKKKKTAVYSDFSTNTEKPQKISQGLQIAIQQNVETQTLSKSKSIMDNSCMSTQTKESFLAKETENVPVLELPKIPQGAKLSHGYSNPGYIGIEQHCKKLTSPRMPSSSTGYFRRIKSNKKRINSHKKETESRAFTSCFNNHNENQEMFCKDLLLSSTSHTSNQEIQTSFNQSVTNYSWDKQMYRPVDVSMQCPSSNMSSPHFSLSIGNSTCNPSPSTQSIQSQSHLNNRMYDIQLMDMCTNTDFFPSGIDMQTITDFPLNSEPEQSNQTESETQTHYSDGMTTLDFDHLLANMETQTSADDFLVGLGLVDIETQTGQMGGLDHNELYDQCMNTVETQTNLALQDTVSMDIQTQTLFDSLSDWTS